MRYEAREKPEKCPACGGDRIATFAYGLIDMSVEMYNMEVPGGPFVLGGCCITDDSPIWSCLQCGIEIHRPLADIKAHQEYLRKLEKEMEGKHRYTEQEVLENSFKGLEEYSRIWREKHAK